MSAKQTTKRERKWQLKFSAKGKSCREGKFDVSLILQQIKQRYFMDKQSEDTIFFLSNASKIVENTLNRFERSSITDLNLKYKSFTIYIPLDDKLDISCMSIYFSLSNKEIYYTIDNEYMYAEITDPNINNIIPFIETMIRNYRIMTDHIENFDQFGYGEFIAYQDEFVSGWLEVEKTIRRKKSSTLSRSISVSIDDNGNISKYKLMESRDEGNTQNIAFETDSLEAFIAHLNELEN
jgi:hypothetical protein